MADLNDSYFRKTMEDSLSHLDEYFKYVSNNWADIVNRNTSLSMPQVQNILLKNWKKLTDPMNTRETKKSIKDKAVKSVPFFQHSIKNPYYVNSNEETSVEVIANKSNIANEKVVSLVSEETAQPEIKQTTTVEVKNMSESENEEMVLPEEDILRLTRPAKRKSMMKKEKSYRKKGSHGSYESEEKTNLVKKIKMATVEAEMTGTQAPNQIKNPELKTINQKSWKPPFIPVCWMIGCGFCEAKKCEVCVMCINKKRCVWRDCPRLKKVDSTENSITTSENGGQTVDTSTSENGDQTVDTSSEESGAASDEETQNDNINSFEKSENIDEVTFKCTQCDRSFKYLKSLNDHVCGSKYKKITCPSCSKVISSSNYSKHLKRHSVSKFKCSRCSKHFISKTLRDNHEKLHTEHNCGICNKKFRRPCALKKHLLLHEDQQQPEPASTSKTVKCKVCDAEQSSIRVLGMHMQSCHKDEAFSCDICSKLVFSKRALREHKKKHKRTEPVGHQEQESTNSNAENIAYIVEDNHNQIDVESNGDNVFVTLQNDDDVEVVQNIFFVSTEESCQGAIAENSVRPVTNIQTQLDFVDF